MEIVIKINDKLYDLIKHYERSLEIIEEENDTLEITLMRAIINGTPLPKGHGRLIDEKVIYNKIRPLVNNGQLDDIMLDIDYVLETNTEVNADGDSH